MHRYPLIILALSVGIVILTGAIVVQRRTQNTYQHTSGSAWSAPLYAPDPSTAATIAPSHISQNIPPEQYAPITFTSYDASPTRQPTAQSPDASLDALSFTLSHPSVHSSPSSATTSFELIPPGLIATTTNASTQSDTQKRLHTYANTVGSVISSYEQSHQTTVSTLTDAFTHRSDATLQQSVVSIGKDLQQVGGDIQALHTVPKEVEGQHAALARAFVEAGQGLQAVAQAQTSSDTEYLKAIRAYNTQTAHYAHAVGDLALTLSLYKVTFDSSEPGSLFMFSSVEK